MNIRLQVFRFKPNINTFQKQTIFLVISKWYFFLTSVYRQSSRKLPDQSCVLTDNRNIIRQRLLLGIRFRRAALIFLFSVHVPWFCKATEKSKWKLYLHYKNYELIFSTKKSSLLCSKVSTKFSPFSIVAFLKAVSKNVFWQGFHLHCVQVKFLTTTNSNKLYYQTK